METETYTFRLGAYDVSALLPQLSQALETRTEMRSREMNPILWNYVDRIRVLNQGKTRSRGARLTLSIVLLLLGLFLFIPGCMSPETLRGPLVAGAIAIVVGVIGLRRAGKKQSTPRRFERAARTLLAGKEHSYEQRGISVCFSAEEMTVSSDGCDDSHIPYERMESIVEAESLYLLVYDHKAIVLQKRDLIDASPETFGAFLMAHKRAYYSVN